MFILISFNTIIPWGEISDIDLNYERFLDTHLLLFYKNTYPWYKRFFPRLKMKEKTERIEIGLMDCDFDKVYYEMHDYLAQYKKVD